MAMESALIGNVSHTEADISGGYGYIEARTQVEEAVRLHWSCITSGCPHLWFLGNCIH